MLRFIEKILSPVQLLSIGYVVIILLGSILLMLPISSTNGSYQFFVDSLFTSASAVSTTGLVVVDTGSYYSTFGEIVILILFSMIPIIITGSSAYLIAKKVLFKKVFLTFSFYYLYSNTTK